MPVGKSRNLNKEKGEAGERLTQQMFGLAPTSGSGCGRFDKQDSKNDFLRVETKTTSKSSYRLKLSDFLKWRSQAARSRNNFFLHIIQETGGVLQENTSIVAVSEPYYIALGGIISLSYLELEGLTYEIKFSDFVDSESIKGVSTLSGNKIVFLQALKFRDLLQEET